MEVKRGILQGAILSPIPFLVFINDFGNSKLQGKLIHFADDYTLMYTANSNSTLQLHT